MKWVEESYARDLHNDLARHFASVIPAIELSLRGAGVNWRCAANRGERSIIVHCFDVRGPEYLCSFDENNKVIAMGRTALKSDTVAAVNDWLLGATLNNLHERFVFVDGQKRSLLKIADLVVTTFPELQKGASHELKHLDCDLHELWFRQADRACKISYYGENQFADAIFLWDQCELFRFTADDLPMLASVLKRWLCDYAPPSALRAEFSWFEIGELATYYEQGKPIEGEFFMSWKSIEDFYTEMKFAPKQQILELIAEIRRRGYDKTLRAGQSMWSLILSRSRRHGLRHDQPCLTFSFKNDGMEICARFAEEQIIVIPQIEFSPQLEALLQRLVGTNID